MANDECYTPLWYMDLVRKVLGTIQLDPASCYEANKLVQAKKIYTKADKGQFAPWDRERIFCNPPYSQPEATEFADRAVVEYLVDTNKEIIFLQNSQTGSDWYQRLLATCSNLCHHNKRISFYGPQLSGKDSNRNDSTTFYFGRFPETFRAVFEEHGTILYTQGDVIRKVSSSMMVQNRLLLEQNKRLSARIEELSQLKLI